MFRSAPSSIASADRRILNLVSITRQVTSTLYTWIPVGGFRVDVGVLVDPLSVLFILLITGVGSLIHVYSIAYMEHDPRRRLFF